MYVPDRHKHIACFHKMRCGSFLNGQIRKVCVCGNGESQDFEEGGGYTFPVGLKG